MNDVTQATSLIAANGGAGWVVGDRAYDSDAFIAHVERAGMQAVIPARSNRKTTRELDRRVYGQRNVIERLFGRLKQFRRVATRYDKTLASFLGFVLTAGTVPVERQRRGS